MSWNRHRTPQYGGSAPATPGFNAVAPEWLFYYGAATAAPAIPAAESTLGFHPWRALSSAQVLPEWINRNLADNRSAANGDNPLNFVSHSRGSLQVEPPCPSQHCRDQAAQAARPLPTPVIEIHSHVAIISSRGSPGRITIRWAGLPLRRVKPPDIRCLPSVSRAAGAALFPKRTLRCRPETMTTLL
jgi:hypothetical protein